MDPSLDSIQQEVIAYLNGEPIATLPEDLFIPPEAMTVLLDLFSGPLDLLLYLIRRQNLDITNIPVMEVTRQYMEYINLMQAKNLDLAAEYLLMAATLAEIKSRLLLPRPPEVDQDEADPRVELVRRLLAYEQMKQASLDLDSLPRIERDVFLVKVLQNGIFIEKKQPEMSLDELQRAYRDIQTQHSHHSHHSVVRENFSVKERMQRILESLSDSSPRFFLSFVDAKEGRGGMIACFLAVLELGKLSLVRIEQASPFSPITVYGISQ